jgi:simple sugar transport system ATP-binding protein
MIRIMGRPAGRLDPAQRRRLGFAFVPEERLGRGAVPDLSLADNALLTGSSRGMVQHGVIRHAMVREFARAVIERFKVKCKGEQAAASSLSGGNLQKFIVGRETMLEPKVIVVAQPTWGLDVGASMLIRQALIDLRDRGVAVLVISEELDELFMISDRIAVMAQGRLSRAVPAAQTSLEQIGAWMGGTFEVAA